MVYTHPNQKRSPSVSLLCCVTYLDGQIHPSPTSILQYKPELPTNIGYPTFMLLSYSSPPESQANNKVWIWVLLWSFSSFVDVDSVEDHDCGVAGASHRSYTSYQYCGGSLFLFSENKVSILLFLLVARTQMILKFISCSGYVCSEECWAYGFK
jgi:hypothetical protein